MKHLGSLSPQAYVITPSPPSQGSDSLSHDHLSQRQGRLMDAHIRTIQGSKVNHTDWRTVVQTQLCFASVWKGTYNVIALFFYFFVCLFFLFVCLFVFLFVCLFVYLFVVGLGAAQGLL